MSFWGDFWGSELTDRKCLKCLFEEILGNQKRPKIPEMSFWGNLDRYIFSYNLLFWADFWKSEST
jgi:hypothetical protein